MRAGGQLHAPAALPPGKSPIVQEAGWAPGPIWMGAENLAPTGNHTIQAKHKWLSGCARSALLGLLINHKIILAPALQ